MRVFVCVRRGRRGRVILVNFVWSISLAKGVVFFQRQLFAGKMKELMIGVGDGLMYLMIDVRLK